MFSGTCPELVESRWHYLHEVLAWLYARREALACLRASFLTADEDMTPDETALLKALAMSADKGDQFWATCSVALVITRWGWDTRGWLHGCPCHDPDDPSFKSCCMKGRRGIELACGHWMALADEAARLDFSANAQRDLDSLGRVDPGMKAELMAAFLRARSSVAQRFHQAKLGMHFATWTNYVMSTTVHLCC